MKMAIRVLPFFVLSLLLHSVAAAVPIRSSPISPGTNHIDECDALLQFGNSFSISKDEHEYCGGGGGRTSYLKTISWKNGTDCCSWDGVTCHGATNSVIGLDLSCSRLRGPLHSNSSLFWLPNLLQLNLTYNDFSRSQIPSRFGIFREMEHLDLSNSGFWGLIPREISHLSKLITLYLPSSPNSWLTVEDHSFGWLLQNLTQLRELVLDGIDMSKVSPISLANLSSALTSLSLSNCDLGGVFPVDIFHLPNLRSLDLSYNPHLTGSLPQANWTGPFVSLILSGTGFHGSIPASLGNLTSMNYLDLSHTKLTGVVPPALGNLYRLTFLSLGSTLLSGFIDFEMFARLKKLEGIFLTPSGLNVSLQKYGNCSFPMLRGLALASCNLIEFPYFLSSSPDLVILDLSGNSIGGQIPVWFGKAGMGNLIVLVLSSNNLTGEIPSSICKATSLFTFDLSNNSLSGSIPECLGNLSGLMVFNLGDNLLQGPLPSLANCTSLEVLNVSYNRIHDTFPRWLRAKSATDQLNLVDLSNNYFSGQLPTNFLLNSTVSLINLAYNDFDGPLPLPPLSMEYYFISNNNFSGEIPRSICSSTFLDIIDMSNNMLTGFIPPCFKNFHGPLSVLDLKGNQFVGPIPDIFARKNFLRTVRLSRNKLEGTLPQSLGYCKNLEVLDLGENVLEGSFPDWLGTLPKLQVLVLRSNRFHGLVGSSTGNLHPFPKLRIFDLSNNKFYGPLPAIIVKLKAMENEENGDVHYMGEEYYQDSVVVVLKGVEIELVKILTIFTTIDFSNNFFEKEIPGAIGNLKALKGLNFSHNNISAGIPSSIGNLTSLEWLDLSSNKLDGMIPRGLAGIPWLSTLNLSYNQLVGPIPQSTQFDTFSHSFDGNPGLCGRPLPKACGVDAQPLFPHGEEDMESEDWIEWRAIPMGYGCGLAFGISVGYIMLETGRPRWLARMLERKVLKIKSRRKTNAASRNRARRSTRGK